MKTMIVGSILTLANSCPTTSVEEEVIMARMTDQRSGGGLLLCLTAVTCAVLGATTADAAAISEKHVTSAVATWVRNVTADARPEAVVGRLEPYIVDDQPAAYIAHLAGGGYCLCGADDLLLPVYLYRAEGTYDPENPSYRYILSKIADRLTKLEEAIAQRSPELEPYEGELARRSRRSPR